MDAGVPATQGAMALHQDIERALPEYCGLGIISVKSSHFVSDVATNIFALLINNLCTEKNVQDHWNVRNQLPV